jgi:hypothetical protein
MKLLITFWILILAGCSSPGSEKGKEKVDSSVATIKDNAQESATTEPIDSTEKIAEKEVVTETAEKNSHPISKVYSNKRFKDVTVQKVGKDKYRVKGKGQIFEASFSWVVEDGHNELKKGHETTDAGAPEWGNFDFVVEVAKQRSNSTLNLIIFETSAKDGSRQYLLPIKLE